MFMRRPMVVVATHQLTSLCGAMNEVLETRSYKIEITRQQVTRLRTTHDLTSFIKISSFGESPRFSEKIQSFKLKCSEFSSQNLSRSENSLKIADFKSKSVKI